MKNALAALKLLLADVAKLDAPAVATAAAGVLAPIIAAVAGVNVTAAELGADLFLAGTIAALLQKLTSGQAAAARKPAPDVPPAPVVVPPAPLPPAK